MYKRLFFLVVFLFYFFLIFGQEKKQLVESGYATLTIKFSGHYPKKKPIGNVSYGTALSWLKPIGFENVNDSTLFLSIYGFGASRIIFDYDKEYKLTQLLPSHRDVIKVHYTDSVNYQMTYEGTYKWLFDQSREFYNLVKLRFSLATFYITGNRGYNSPNKYKDDILELIQIEADSLARRTQSEKIREMVRITGEYYNKKLLLFDEYPATFYIYTLGPKADSLQKAKIDVKRDFSYYDGVITPQLVDTSRFQYFSYDLLSTIQKDTLLHLPDIATSGINPYLTQLKKAFGKKISNENNLFYDMMIAIAYINEIEAGLPLSEKSKYEILDYFKNEQISNYILYQNLLLRKPVSRQEAYYLPYPKTRVNVLGDILKKYTDKVIIMDFWATWCGPCIGEFPKSKALREKFKDRQDVVFLYITGESSDPKKWKAYVDDLGSEHYYLYSVQLHAIEEKFKINTIPHYLIFDKRGGITETISGVDMSVEEFKRYIDAAFAK